MATEIEIVNRALILLGEEPIATIDDNNKFARTMRALLPTARPAFLRAHPWKFAKARASLAKDPVNPIFGKSMRYHLPGDCLRVLWLNDRDLNFDVEGDYIHSDFGPPLSLVYIKDVQEYGRWDALATVAFAAQLALDASNNVTGKDSERNAATDTRNEALSAARHTNATEQSVEIFDADVWIQARQTSFN